MKRARMGLLLLLLAGALVLFAVVWGTGFSRGLTPTPQGSAAAAIRNDFSFKTVSLNGYTDEQQYAGSGANLSFYAGWQDTFFEPYTPPTVLLQQRVGNATTWTTVRKVPFDRDTTLITNLSYKVPAKMKSVSVQYRFTLDTHAGSTSWNPASSSPVTVVYENQARYTGLAKTMYGYMKGYCPNAAVHVVKAVKGGENIGYYHGGGYQIDILASAATYEPAYRKAVALHECAHERQFLNWGATSAGWDAMKAAAANIFVDDTAPAGVTPPASGGYTGAFIPYEHAADCAALSVNPRGYLGYGGYCNSQELAAGRALLRGDQF